MIVAVLSVIATMAMLFNTMLVGVELLRRPGALFCDCRIRHWLLLDPSPARPDPVRPGHRLHDRCRVDGLRQLQQ